MLSSKHKKLVLSSFLLNDISSVSSQCSRIRLQTTLPRFRIISVELTPNMLELNQFQKQIATY